MTFNSVEYAVFLLAVLGGYWALPRRGQNALLLVAGYVFYGWWDARFLLLLATSTLIDYSVARPMSRSSGPKRRRWLALSVVANLGILATFKYWGFFTDSASTLARGLGLDWAPPVLEVVLPVGISFYTFQSMSYAIDVFRRHIEPSRDLIEYATFVSFFPQLVAGPIERAGHLLPQFAATRTRPDAEQVSSALALILVGLFRKVVIADAMAPLVAEGFGSGASGGATLVAFYAFALQIYGDFAGYSAIARGSARLLGIELMVNFNAPYLARNPTELWRRWHISLSTWLRDYLYVPLGGNRRGPGRQRLNLLVVMLVGGLWHGASWTFVAWGGIHGVLLVVHHWWRARHAGPETSRRGVLPVLATFHATCLAWVFFRASSFDEAGQVLSRLAESPLSGLRGADLSLLALAAAATAALDAVVLRHGDEGAIARWQPAERGVAMGVLALAILVYAGAEPVPFIYFQF